MLYRSTNRRFPWLAFVVFTLLASGGLITAAGVLRAQGVLPKLPCPTLCTPTPGPTPCISTEFCPTPTPGPTPCSSFPCPTPTSLRDAAGRGVVEWQFTDDGPPHPAAALTESASPWFGWAGARVYLSWQAGDPEAVIYLPPPSCQWTPAPWQPTECTSVCPPQFSCFVGSSTYRHPDSDPAHHQAVLVLGPVGFQPGLPGTLVVLRLPGDRTARWVLP